MPTPARHALPPRRPRTVALVALLAVVAGAVAPSGRASARGPPRPTPPAADLRARFRVPDSATGHLLTLRDRTTLVGRLTAVGADGVRFQSTTGESSIAIATITCVREAPTSAIRSDGEAWFPNPNASPLLFAPTGRAFPRGTGRFSGYFTVFPGVAYGATDRVTIGGGVSLIRGSDEQLLYVTPEVGFTTGTG